MEELELPTILIQTRAVPDMLCNVTIEFALMYELQDFNDWKAKTVNSKTDRFLPFPCSPAVMMGTRQLYSTCVTCFVFSEKEQWQLILFKISSNSAVLTSQYKL